MNEWKRTQDKSVRYLYMVWQNTQICSSQAFSLTVCHSVFSLCRGGVLSRCSSLMKSWLPMRRMWITSCCFLAAHRGTWPAPEGAIVTPCMHCVLVSKSTHSACGKAAPPTVLKSNWNSFKFCSHVCLCQLQMPLRLSRLVLVNEIWN